MPGSENNHYDHNDFLVIADIVVEVVNQRLARVETIKKFKILKNSLNRRVE